MQILHKYVVNLVCNLSLMALQHIFTVNPLHVGRNRERKVKEVCIFKIPLQNLSEIQLSCLFPSYDFLACTRIVLCNLILKLCAEGKFNLNN